ncbi:FecR family protein, partial [Pacificimonas flava]
MIFARLFGFLAVLLSWSASALAAPDWQITEVTGDVIVARGSGEQQPTQRGTLLKPGDMLRTGPGGRAVVTRGEEYVIVAPGSQLRLPEAGNPRSFGQILQDLGTALFKIEKKATPHFEVRTPYLAAVVKGTNFSVTVNNGEASVQVTEGSVSVEALDGLSSVLLTPGEIAVARTGGPVEVLDPNAPPAPASDTPADAQGDEPSAEADSETPADAAATDEDGGETVGQQGETVETAGAESASASTSVSEAGTTRSTVSPRIRRAISSPRTNIADVTDGLVTEVAQPSGSASPVQIAAVDAATTRQVVRDTLPGGEDTGGSEPPAPPAEPTAPDEGDSGGDDPVAPEVPPVSPEMPDEGNGGGQPDTPGNGNGGGKPDLPGNGNGGGKPDLPGNGNGGGQPDTPGNGNG